MRVPVIYLLVVFDQRAIHGEPPLINVGLPGGGGINHQPDICRDTEDALFKDNARSLFDCDAGMELN